MKAILRKYLGETVESEEVIELPDNYDGDPYGDTVPFAMASNWTLQLVDEDFAVVQAAITQWDDQAAYYSRMGGPTNENISRTCRLAAESLRLELKTGKPHCGCTDPPHEIK